MTEKKFFNYNLADNKNQFDYGRRIEKKSIDENLVLPYKKFRLFFLGGPFSKVKGYREYNYVHTGMSKGGILKGGIRIQNIEQDDLDKLQKTKRSGKPCLR